MKKNSGLSSNNIKSKYFNVKNILFQDSEDSSKHFFKSKLPVPGNTEDSMSQIWTVVKVEDSTFYNANSSQDDSFDNALLWDLFSTNNVYVNKVVFNKLQTANDVLPLVYYTNVLSGSNLSEYDTKHGDYVKVNIPSGDPIMFKRFINTNYNGWLTYFEHGFNVVESDQVDAQLEIPFENQENGIVSNGLISKEITSFQKAMDSFSSNLSKKPISMTAQEISDLLTQLKKGKSLSEVKKAKFISDDISKDDILHKIGKKITSYSSEKIINNTIGDNKNMDTSCPTCVYYTYKNDSINVNIVSKEYKFANIPSGIPICSNSKLINSEGITYCSFSLNSSQQACSMYEPNRTLLKKYITNGSNAVTFSVTSELDQEGKTKISIYNDNIGQLSYCLYPPVDATEEQIMREVDSIIDEVLSSWSSEVKDTLKIENTQKVTAEQKEKKSFILSLV